MAGTVDPKVVAAEVGRTALLTAVRQSAGMNLMERQYQQAMSDLQSKAQMEGMASDVKDLPEEEKLAEVLSRFCLIVIMLSKPETQPMVMWHLYTHLRSTGFIEAVKPNIGSIVDLAGRRIPPKEGA
jgi:hypothetical protein